MRCQELLAILNEYVDGTLAQEFCAEFDRHLGGCQPCQVVVDTVRKTITLYRNGQPYPLPARLRSRLHQMLRARWRQLHP